MELSVGSKTTDKIGQLLLNFDNAVAEGNEELAAQLVKELARKRTLLKLQFVTLESKPAKEISVKVHITNRFNQRNEPWIVKMNVRLSFTIYTLKNKLFEMEGYPLRNQFWIFCGRFALDDSTLADCGMTPAVTELFCFISTLKYPSSAKKKIVHILPTPKTKDPVESKGPSVQTVPADRVKSHQAASLSAAKPSANGDCRKPTIAPKPSFAILNSVGWQCMACTLINEPTRPGCSACNADRPVDYKLPMVYRLSKSEMERLERQKLEEEMMKMAEEESRRRNYQSYCKLEASQNVVHNSEPFTCPICFDDVPVGEGIVLHECLHMFCLICIRHHIQVNSGSSITCPYIDGNYICTANLLDREIKYVGGDEDYERYLGHGLSLAEMQAQNSFHCKTPNCRGFCFYEDAVNVFNCGVCGHDNCLTCKAIHENMNCKQYQDDLLVRSKNDEDAHKTNSLLNEMVAKGEGIRCPQCGIIVTKKDGCDWLMCTMCKTELCWVTRQRRWGPKGVGDTSAGCQCNVNGRRCHPQCQNCH